MGTCMGKPGVMILRLCQNTDNYRVRVAKYIQADVYVMGEVCDDQQQNVTDVMRKLVSVGNKRKACLLTRYNAHPPSIT